MNQKKISLVEHLEELRRRLIVCFIVIIIFSLVSSFFSDKILQLLKKPAGSYLKNLAYFSPTEGVWAYIKIALGSGLILSTPFVLFEIWRFISPALQLNERRVVQNFLWAILLFFIAGIAFGYYILIPFALKFLLNFASAELIPLISVDKYLSFVFILLLGCGVIFEMPLLILLLNRLKLVSSTLMRRQRKIAILTIFIISAIITPTPDAFSMLLMAGPMLFLYEVSIGLTFFAEKRRKNNV